MIQLKIEDTYEAGLHDYVLEDICVDYRKAVIMFKLVSVSQDGSEYSCELCIEEFCFFSITRKEPWGSGILIFYSEVEKGSDGFYKLYLQLNSGDEIEVRFENKRADEDG